jgi:hypothetical protein
MDEMLILSLAGLAILIFLLSLLQWIIQQRMTNGRLISASAFASAWIFYQQLQEMREEKRAWVGPISAGFANGLPQEGNPATVNVQHHNTGREPAIDVFSDLSPYVVTLEEDQAGVTATHVRQFVEKCREKQPVIGAQVIFPTTSSSYYTTSTIIEGNLIDWDVLYGTRLIIITGCYVYKTLGITHRTSFCYWFQNSPRMTAQSWGFCLVGNYAD